MIISPSIELPAVVRKSLQAYSAGDPVTFAEAFDIHATCLLQYDAKLGRRIGLKHPMEPVLAEGVLGIMEFYSRQLSVFDVLNVDVLSSMRAGRDVAFVCAWNVRLRGTGLELAGRCHNIWTLDNTGRKVVVGRSVSKVITPAWDMLIN